MKKIRLSELEEAVRSFFASVKPDETVVVENDKGELQYGVTPYVRATPTERQEAMAWLERMWEKTDRAMREAGVTEDDIDRVLQEDD